MAKFLLWVVVIIAVLMVTRILNLKKSIKQNTQVRPNPANHKSEQMVRCEHCSIYLPRSEAYMSRGKTWCCAEHAKLGLKK